MAQFIGWRSTRDTAPHRTCSSTNHFLSLSEHLADAPGRTRGLRQGPMARAAAMALLRSRELQPALEVQLPRGDRLIDVAADGVHLARPRIDIRHHLAMGAPDRARLGAGGELHPDALAHRLVADAGQRGLALLAKQIARARFRCGKRARAIEPVAGLLGRLGRARRERVVDVDAMRVGELERVRRRARLPDHVADEGRRPRRIDDGRAQRRLAQHFALRRVGRDVGEAQQPRGAGSQQRRGLHLLRHG